MRFFIFLSLFILTFSTQAVKVRVVSEDLPPFQIENHGQKPTGALVEIVNLMLVKAQIDAEIEVLPWARSYAMAQKQENIIIFSMLRDETRENKFQWIGKIYALHSFLVALKSNTSINITSLEQARKYSVASVREDLASHYLHSNGFVEGDNLYLSSNYKVLWQMLFNGRTDLAFTNSVLWRHEITHSNLNPEEINVVYNVPDFAQDLYVAASLTTDKKVVEKLSAILIEIKENGEYQAILDKWQL